MDRGGTRGATVRLDIGAPKRLGIKVGVALVPEVVFIASATRVVHAGNRADEQTLG